MKQFTWQLMCKKFKKTLKINFLYLTCTLPRTNHTTSSTSVFSAHQHNEISWCAERQAVLLKETLVLREVTLVLRVNRWCADQEMVFLQGIYILVTRAPAFDQLHQ